ncbi:MAG: hypothetical protein ACRDVE_11900 [Actinocrinis sp.]
MAEYASHRSAGRLVELAAAVIAVIIVLHILFVLVGANGGNSIVSTDADWASTLAAWFRDLFTLSNAKLSVVVNYGLATLFYLAVGRIVAAFVNRA